MAGWKTHHDRNGVELLVALVAMALCSPTLSEEPPISKPVQIGGKSCVTNGCHDTLMEPQFLHAPVVDNACLRCHQETDRVNHKYRMVADAPVLCFACHVKMQAKLQNTTVRPHHHKPVYEGKCLECHNPHASNHPMMLRNDSVVDMCMSCHQKKMSLAGHVHKPIEEKGCLECHRGHDSDNEKLLRAVAGDLCLRCHADKYQESATLHSVHKPFAEKNCVGCHTPHASPQEKLLAKTYGTDLYVPFNEQNYELCFSCHKRELATNPTTTDATNFRNGERNLHFLHVDKDSKGRSCRICHLPHGSPLSRLIRPEVPFGDWKLVIRYEATKTGGYCALSCHPAKRYDRVVPIDLTQEPIPPSSDAGGP